MGQVLEPLVEKRDALLLQVRRAVTDRDRLLALLLSVCDDVSNRCRGDQALSHNIHVQLGKQRM